MSIQSDGQDRPDNIDTIKQLLLKLEEVAARDGADGDRGPEVHLEYSANRNGEAQSSAGTGSIKITLLQHEDRPRPADVIAVAPGLDLAVLRRGTSLTQIGPGTSTALVSKPIDIDVPMVMHPPALPVVVERTAGLSGRGRAGLLAAASFVLGIAAAGLLITAFDPFKAASRQPVMTAQSPLPDAAAASARNETASPITTGGGDRRSQAAVAIGSSDTNSAAAMPGPQPQAPAHVGTGEAQQAQVAPAAVEPQRPSSEVPTAAEQRTEQVQEAAIESRPPTRTAELAASGGSVAGAAVIAPNSAGAVAAPSVPIADAKPRLSVPRSIQLRAGDVRAIDVHLQPPVNADAKLLVVFRHVPAWLKLSKGGALGNGIWLLQVHETSGIAIEAEPGGGGTAEITVQLAHIDGQMIAESRMMVQVLARGPDPASTFTGTSISQEFILRLQARGELLLDTGEIEAARTLLRTAAEAGSVVAALRLAETYDPAEIPRLGMHERSANTAMAVQWYEVAQALGSPVATDRLVALGRK